MCGGQTVPAGHFDVGCGDGTQTIQVASLNPHIEFTGLDSSSELLTAAAAQAESQGVTNVRWIEDNLMGLRQIARGQYDAVISTMTLHDLPDSSGLDEALASIASICSSDAAIYLEDFTRLKANASIEFFLGMNAPLVPDDFSVLYRSSMQAAHTIQELKQAIARHLPWAAVYTTFIVPFLMVAKTHDGPLLASQRTAIINLRQQLPNTVRHDLDELRRSFALGGLRNDPFV